MGPKSNRCMKFFQKLSGYADAKYYGCYKAGQLVSIHNDEENIYVACLTARFNKYN